MKQMIANALSMHVHDERNGLDYTLHGDYYLPGLEVPPTLPLNHWGLMALDRLEKQHPGRFTRMLLGGSLYPYCQDIAQQAQEWFDVLMQGYQRCWGIDESLKGCDPMEWVGRMNQARAQAEQNIFEEILSLS